MANNKTFRKAAISTMAASTVVAAVAPAVSADSASGFSDVTKEGIPSHYDAIMNLSAQNVITGYEDDTFRPWESIYRAQVAAMLSRAKGLKAPSDLESSLDVYTDVNVDSDNAAEIAAVTEAGYFQGNSGVFSSWTEINREQMATVLVRAFDLDSYDLEDVAVNLDNVSPSHQANVQILANAGITTETEDFNPTGDVTRASFATFLDRAQKFVAEQEAAAPEVKSVSAINAEEIQVTFSKNVDIATASNAANYELEINGADETGNIEDISVSGNTATIRLDGVVFSSGDKFVLQVKDSVKGVNGEQVERFTTNEVPFDVTSAPAVVSSGFNGADLVLEFDRPVDTTTTLIKLDGVALGSSSLAAVDDTAAGNYKYTVSGLTADEQTKAGEAGDHEVVIFDLADTKGTVANVASVVTSTYNLSADQQAPEVVSVESLNANKFFIELSEAATATDASFIVEKGNHTFTVGGDNSQLSTDVSAGAGDENNKVYYEQGTYLGKPGYYVTITEPASGELNPLYKDGETSVSLNVTFENYKDSADYVGSKYEGTVTLSKDSNKPAIETTAISGSNLVIDFDGALSGAPALSDVVVRDKDGVIITPTGITLNGSDVVEITLGSVADEPYTVEFAEGKVQYEVVKNDVSAYNLNANKNDVLTATVQSTSNNFFKYVEFVTNGTTPSINTDNEITVDYGVEMDNSALSVSNYQLDGKALPAGTEVDFVGDKTTVQITLPEGSFETSTDYKFTIDSSVTTKDGVRVVGDLQTKKAYETVLGLTDNVAPTVAGGQYLVANDTDTTTTDLIVKFSEVITTPDSDDFKVTVQGSTQTVASISDTDTSDEYVVITLSDAVNVGQSATVEVVPEGDDNAVLSVEDADGNKATGSVTVSTKTKDNQGN
ncbi:S-layer homology domain-containing protein [Oceanobacillus limi]|uniref:S-layer homology domain-containing protein n=1 Tax=Oceanobacillus limi TaxID=930131 RepID=A0A1I0A4G3_9BACI|nr:S-layer homology domain-containing protein [Oceanobacillus limi]SES88082.1 S-layer homology domain-containing protein [Oceanobacillus limi]